MNSISSNNLSFGSIKPEMRMAEKVLKDFQKEMGPIKSSSKIFARMLPHFPDPNPKKAKLIESLEIKKEKLHREIHDSQHNNFYDKTHASLDELVIEMKEFIKKKGGKANCDTISVIIYNMLKQKGLNPQRFGIDPTGEGAMLNHTSIVFGLKKGAKITEPYTWGNKAIIVDGWKNIVMHADEGLEFLKKGLINKDSRVKFEITDQNPKFTPNPPMPKEKAPAFLQNIVHFLSKFLK